MSDAPHRKKPLARWIAAVILFALVLAIFAQLVRDNSPKGEVRKLADYTPWRPETIAKASEIPLQDGGRVKPLSTYAGFTMLRLHGARSMKIRAAGGREVKLQPAEWLLDTLFRPHLAILLPTFRVDNSAALEAIGVKALGKRDRYSYDELRPGLAKLAELSASYMAKEKEAKNRDPLQNQIIDLQDNVASYELLLGYFSFARNGVTLAGSGTAGAPDSRAAVSSLMATAPTLRQQIALQRQQTGNVTGRLRGLLDQVLELVNYSRGGLLIIPPSEIAPAGAAWRAAGPAIMEVMNGTDKEPETATEDVKAWEALARSPHHDGPEWDKALAEISSRVVARAQSRGEYKHIPLEVSYYRKNEFLRAWVCFLLGCFTALTMWIAGKSKTGRILAWATAALTVSGVYFCVSAIVKRIIIMERPPVGNLYDTIVFIGTTVVIIALILELLTKRRFALGTAAFLGALLMGLSRLYEVGDAKDHMDPLVAVLISNFWLTWHVLTISLGYSAGLLGAFLSVGYIFMRGFGLDGSDLSIRRSFTRAAYGIICLTLLLSLVGTVLGGIWANYSWGRFWGWDPKENGALMIVIWTLAILHARLGGFIREWGLHLASVFTAVVVTFSWWHVNFLGVGLHNYGFTAGKGSIWIFYSVMLAVFLFGMIVMLIEKSRRKTSAQPAGEQGETVTIP